MLCALHCLIETGDPGGAVSFEDRRKVFETATHNAQSTRSHLGNGMFSILCTR